MCAELVDPMVSELDASRIRRRNVRASTFHTERFVRLEVERATREARFNVPLDRQLPTSALGQLFLLARLDWFCMRLLAPIIRTPCLRIAFPALAVGHDLDGSKHLHAPIHARPQT